MAVDTIQDVRTYLTFRLGQEIFALDVAAVREVLDFTSVTKVPRTPEFMRGVINLRGSVVPVLDLRLAFGMSITEKTVNTCIIVVEVSLDPDDHLVIGALADSVQEVIEMEPDQIQPAPNLGSALKTEFIRGMGKRDGDFVMILDIDKVFSNGHLESLKSAAV